MTKDNDKRGFYVYGCNLLRDEIKILGARVRSLTRHPENIGCDGDCSHDHDEMGANVMLAFRHLEDAQMRLGKAIQAYEGGE